MSRSNHERYTAVRQSFWRKPKTVALSLAGIGLWTLGQSYCSDEMTDGFIADGVALMLSRGDKKALKNLVDSTYWLRVEGGYQVNKYLKHNLSREELQARSDAKKAAGSRGGQARARALASATADGVATATADAKREPGQSPSESLQDLRPQTSDGNPPLRVGEEEPPRDLATQVHQLLAHGPETPAAAWRLLELLTALEASPDPDHRVHIGMASAADLGRMGKILEAARRDAPGLETTPMRMVAVEWSSLLALVAAGHIAPPKAPAPYFQKLFGQLSSKHQEAAE